MNVFGLRQELLGDYRRYVESFIKIQDSQIKTFVQERLDQGALWPDPLVQLNPTFEAGASLPSLVEERVLHPETLNIFRLKDRPNQPLLSLHRHQEQAIRCAGRRENYVVTTGTGSGKSLTYIIPIVNYILQQGSGKSIKAIVVYPMNALANSQLGELEKFINKGYPNERGPVRFARYTGQEDEQTRRQIQANPPDILLTNYMMLDLILTRPRDSSLVDAAKDLKFLVLDELHTYRGRQGADVAFLVRRLRERLEADKVICIGTSATMSSNGGRVERQRTVAEVASRIFGLPVQPQNVIGETLKRTTVPLEVSDPSNLQALKERVIAGSTPKDFQEFVQDPLASWVESVLGLREEEGILERQNPSPLSGPHGLAAQLAGQLGLDEPQCLQALQECLLAGYEISNPHTGLKAFAFRLHQFLSRGDTVYASLEPSTERHLTLQAQQFVPDSRDKVLMPLAFCRECGQEYYTVWRRSDPQGEYFEPRRVTERYSELGGEAGLLYAGEWPSDLGEIVERVPEDWLEQGGQGLKRDKRDRLPKSLEVSSDGRISQGQAMHYLTAPFDFCLCCGVGYGARQSSDFGKLTTLGTEGRSTATTVLSLSTVTHLASAALSKEARKLLSFTDNRQDASLQAGHFNDFVQTSLLRSAVYRAVMQAGTDGLRHDQLTQQVFKALNLDIKEYASNPEVKFGARNETEKALQDILGYRIYRDLLRGWRITAPNLEQVGLLNIEYQSLDELCGEESEWQGYHPALVGATPQERAKVARVLLDYLRKELVIKVDFLNRDFQNRMSQSSSSRLSGTWALEDNEKLEYARIAYTRPNKGAGSREAVYVSTRSAFGQYLKRTNTFPNFKNKLSTADLEGIIKDLFRALEVGGMVEIVDPENQGYQAVAASFIWKEGDGRPPTEPLRYRFRDGVERSPNPFFSDFYRFTALNLGGVLAREHTAQVPAAEREVREEMFRRGDLPVLYCSPTMELGVDISTLNVVNMRNVPPTPANYAQRSGRAGRSGSPALVFTYASTGNSHDQYFFRRPLEMVSGRVKPPRLDLTNEELIRTHMQAVWLAETGADLGRSLVDILQVEGEAPSLELHDSLKADFHNLHKEQRALARAQKILRDLQDELGKAPWHTDDWLSNVMRQAPARLVEACGRWKSLYTAAREQAALHGRVILDASRAQQEKDQSRRLRSEAESQLRLLTDTNELAQSDFYSYRYFASEGFLPGYSFPRLPLSAFIPARRGPNPKDDFLSRPRFLAITEFAPFSTLYYEGAKYVANKVILPPGSEEELRTLSIKRCDTCGYLHSLDSAGGPDLCLRCNSELPRPRQNLLRMQNVSTVRRDRINSDEEERQRLGYEVLTGVSFPPVKDRPSFQSATAKAGNLQVELTFSQAASIWRMNLGWLNRKNPNEEGFLLDPERGYWAKRSQDPEEVDDQNPTAKRVVQVIPFVEDRKNTLLFTPQFELSEVQFASLLAALKSAIQITFQLEETELAGELLPNDKQPRELLFYEAAEGGAGVLRQLAHDPQALVRVARTALNLCHFDEQGQEPPELQPTERCEAACYDCLMNYSNQRFHRLLDRKAIRDILVSLAESSVAASGVEQNRQEHLETLLRVCDSDLERSFLRLLEERRLALPSHAQYLIAEAQTRADFYYQEARTVVYIDGPHHLYPNRRLRDQQQERFLRMSGYSVVRLAAHEDWEEVIADRTDVFGGSA